MNELSHLFEQLKPTNNPLVYTARPFQRDATKPLWVTLIGPSGAGKDSIKEKLLHTGRFIFIKTATNRQPRKDELGNEYFWMRKQFDGEPQNSYLRELVKEHQLFEYSFHYGNMYGTPLLSIKDAILAKKTPLYCSENQGAQFMEKSLATLFNVLTIMIVPDQFEDMERRILQGNRDNPTARLHESLQKIAEAPYVAHYVVKNPSKSVDAGKSGLESAVGAVKRVIEGYL